MTREEFEKIASDYLNDCESEFDMLEVFALAKEAIEQKSKPYKAESEKEETQMERKEHKEEIKEAIKQLKKCKSFHNGSYGKALNMGIEALEQEPCEDAISRQAVLDLATTIETDDNSGNELLEVVEVDSIKSLPPVTPTRKKGHWIEEKNDYGEVTGWHCDKCYEDSGFTTTCKWDFCPNCGTEMESEE